MMKRATTAWHGQSTKQAKKQILRTYPTWDFARRSGDSWVQTIGVTQGELGQSTEIGKKQLLYEIGVTAAPHPVHVHIHVHQRPRASRPAGETS